VTEQIIASGMADRRKHFVESLMVDLTSAGFTVSGKFGLGKTSTIVPPDQRCQISCLHQLWDQQLDEVAPFIEHMERHGVLAWLADGRAINALCIRPEIHICISEQDHNLFRYAKLFQQIPTTRRVGRQLRALVYDVGQADPSLMGIIELASSPYTLGCRDDYLDWRGNKRKIVKDFGLRRVMDLACVMALPPYNFFFGGKLMAALASSETIRQTFKSRYGTELLGLIATSVTGLHCALLNRIGIKAGGLYRRIGATGGYTTIFVSARTLSEARQFLPGFVSAPEGHFSASVRPLHVLRVAMRACGIPPEAILRSAYPKGVYFGSISEQDMTDLRTGKMTSNSTAQSVDKITQFWLERFVRKALADKARTTEIMAYLRRGPRNNPLTSASQG
jgi:hypothetical protein